MHDTDRSRHHVQLADSAVEIGVGRLWPVVPPIFSPIALTCAYAPASTSVPKSVSWYITPTIFTPLVVGKVLHAGAHLIVVPRRTGRTSIG